MKRAISLLMVLVILASNVSVFAETTITNAEVSNKALGIIRKIESTIPREVSREDIEGELPTEAYAKYARFLFYLEELEKLNSTNGDKLTTEKDSLEAYQKSRVQLSKEFGDITKSNEASQFVLQGIEKDITQLVDRILGEESSGDSETELYKSLFPIIRDKMKVWGDFIFFLRSDIGMQDEPYRALVGKYDTMFNGLQRVNQIAGEDMNLGFSRPQDTFTDSIIVTDTITDDNGDLHQWFVEVLSLTSKIRAGEKMDDYLHLLSPSASEMYEKHRANRVPLYTSIENDPIKSLMNDSQVTLKQTNLTNFIENIDDDMVLYLPRGDKVLGRTRPLARESIQTENTEVDDNNEEVQEDENTTGGDNFVPNTITDKNMLSEDSKFVPVYVKALNYQNKKHFLDDEITGELYSLTQSSALMNHMQLINYSESGHLNDLNADLGYPLYIDLYGNIVTHTGIIIIPALSNVTFMSGSNYLPFNAYFMNNYPNESTGREIDSLNLFTSDPKKYVITIMGNSALESLAGTQEDEEETGNPDIDTFNNSAFTLSKFHKKGIVKKEYKVGFMDNVLNMRVLPNLVFHVDTEDGVHPFMRITKMNKDALLKMNQYSIVGLKEQIAVSDEGQEIRFTNIHEDVPVERWVFNHYWGVNGDRRLLKNTMFEEISKTVLNTEIDFDIIKVPNAIAKSKGFKLGSILEPVHKMISESNTNYVLYTPSLAELPGMNRYASTFMMPILTVLLLLALLFAILDAIRAPNIEWSKLIVTLLVIFGTNWAVTNFYPAMLNIGFNGAITKIMGSKADQLALYNVEKDLNSKGEFVYTDKPSKIISDGASIKIGELEKEEAQRIRKAEEGSPWKDSPYYHPKWDPGEMHIGSTVYVKGDTLNIYVKDLFSSANIVHDGIKYNLEWYQYPDYSYYIPYLNIMEGITQTLNTYSQGDITPKKIRYSNGFTGTTGTALTYFMSEFFLTDETSAMARGEKDPGFLEAWREFNNSDFLNLQSVMRMEPNEDLGVYPKFEFPFETDFRTRTTRWYKTAVNGRKERDIARKIKDINLSTRQYAMTLLPYMDNITDEVIIKSIALHATQEFSKEFSHSPVEKATFSRDYIMGLISSRGGQDYFTDLYPKNIEMNSITYDEHMKLSFVNMHDLLKFHITALYPYLESQSTWFGMLIFFVISILIFIRSLMRITFISVIVFVGLIYMVLVYAIRRDYSNKTVFGIFQIILISWFVYLIDNLMFLAFMNFDKGSAGVLFLIMVIWLLWNVTAIAVYLQLFLYFIKDIRAFGGNIFLENANAVLGGITKIAKAMARPFSETTAENIDFTKPNWEMQQEDFEEYMNKDVDEKMRDVKDETHDTMASAASSVRNRVYDNISQIPTLKGEYNRGVSQGLSGSQGYSIQAIVLPPDVKDYLRYKGVDVSHGPYGNNMTADMDTWAEVVRDTEIKTDKYELYKEGKDGDIYLAPTELSRDLLNRTGIEFLDLNESFAVRGTDINRVEELADSIRKPLYRINKSKGEALKIAEQRLSPDDYEIGNNAVYLKNEEDAQDLFPNENELTYQTMLDIVDREDKLRGGGYINSSMDVVNGSLITSEYVYGKVTKATQRSLLSEEVKLMGMGKERFKFNIEDRSQVMEAVGNSAKYMDSADGIFFREKSMIDRFVVKGSKSEDEEEDESTGDKEKITAPKSEEMKPPTHENEGKGEEEGEDSNIPFIVMELDDED